VYQTSIVQHSKNACKLNTPITQLDVSRRMENNAAKPGKSFGKGMWVITWLIGIAMLTMFFAEREETRINPNQTPVSSLSAEGIKEVSLKRNQQGHYVTSGKINDVAAVFLLDTGATDVVVSGRLAKKYGLNRGPANRATTANGTTLVYATRIDRLQIGDIILYDVAASINPNMDDFILLGMSALKHIEFSQRDNILTLRYHQ